MPAVKYAYDYSEYNKRSQKGVVKTARPVSPSSNMSAQRKVSSSRTMRTPESTKNMVRSVTSQNAPKRKATTNVKKREHVDIDIPITVKKKVVIEKPKEMKLTKPKSKAKSRAKANATKKGILLGMIIVALLFLICMRYAEIDEKFNRVAAIEKDLASVRALNEQLNANIESKTDLGYIEKYAKYQLGMQKPTESQIVRIAYEKRDKISTPIIIDEEEDSSFLSKLLNDLKNLID